MDVLRIRSGVSLRAAEQVSKRGGRFRLIFLAMLLLSLAPRAFGETPVDFRDADLEDAIRWALDQPTGVIYPTDLAGLEELDGSAYGISDLTGLEYCTNLIFLDLDYNEISDLGPLAGLENLNVLWLYENRISDPSPLAGLENLTDLDLGFNQISGLGPLAGLANLTELWLYANRISDPSPLAGLENLMFLDLGDNAISDISSLEGLGGLTELYLDYNQIVDITALAGLENLTLLWLSYNQISDIEPLVSNLGLASGDTVDLSENPLSCDSILADIPALEARGVVVDWTNSGQCLDTDGDGVADPEDNCIDVPNGPILPDAGGHSQLDTDGDGYGDVCDCDFNQDGGCGQPDYSVFIACFGKPVPASGPADDPTCEESDMNGDGGVGQPDYSLFISLFGGLPGPSGVADGGGGVASAAQAPCGLGSELALLLPPLMWLWRRRRRVMV